jgi:hypothetical protein
MSGNADRSAGNELLGKLRKMRMLADDDDATTIAGPSRSQTSQQPAWMRSLLDRSREWLSYLPAVRSLEHSEKNLIHFFSLKPEIQHSSKTVQ